MFSILSRRCPLLATSLSVLFCLLSMLISDSRFDLVWFRLSCDHGWVRSGSVNVRKQQQQLARLLELSLGALPPREPPESTLSGSVPSRHLLGAVAVYYRGSPQYSIVQKTILREIFSPFPRLLELSLGALPPESTLTGSVPSRHLLDAVAVYYRGSPQYSIVQKLFWWKSFPHSPGSQSCLWERFPPESTLSGSVPSRHLLGAVPTYHRRSLQYSIVQSG